MFIRLSIPMKIRILTFISLLACIAFISCDDTTDTIGTSLTDKMDLLNVETDTFNIFSRSIIAERVLSRNTTGYLGKIRDPETGNYITGNFMAQFNTLENYKFPSEKNIVSFEGKDTIKGIVVADSCIIRLFYTNYYGDSLATMNLTAYEMKEAMKEGVKYYSDFNPKQFIRTDNGIKINKTYTLSDLSISSEDRADADIYTPHIKIVMNKEYTDKEGNIYNNYGTYVMKKYYENSDNFKNSYNFINNVCPGFYFEMNDGLGSMAYISVSQLNVYFKYATNDTVLVGTAAFSGTEEVLQTTNISNDRQALENLINDNTCSYLKTPAGIFTELKLPINDIIRGHENDTINSAKVTLPRINNTNYSKFALNAPSTLLMIPRDSLYSFFENEDIVDYKKSYLATYMSTSNSYTFSNISGLITYLADIRNKGMAFNPNWESEHENWDKVVIIPVTVTTNTSGQVVNVVHDMGLSSTRLVKGKEDDSPLKISVIYSKFNH